MAVDAPVPSLSASEVALPNGTARSVWWLGLAVAGILGGLYVWFYLDRGWIPFDEGTLAHSAERVLQGELPHRDFIEVYTGGLTYLNALAFRVFGVHLLATRYMLFIVFLFWVPALYYAASRLASPIAAAAVVLLAVLWSVPNYPAALGSWYNLFFATFGLAALLAYVETPQRRWLVLAGLAGGLSVLGKVTGLFFVGAGVVWLVYSAASEPAPEASPRSGPLVFRVVGGLPLVAAAAALLGIGWARGRWEDLYQFTLPGMVVLGVVTAAVGRARGDLTARARRLAGGLAWFLLGVLVPLGAFVAFYAVHNALPELLRGTVTLVTRRLVHSSVVPLSPLHAGPTLGMAFLLWVGTKLKGNLATIHQVLVIGLLALALRLAMHGRVNALIFSSLAQAIPLVIVALAVLIARSQSPHTAAVATRSRGVLIAIVAALCSLVQYPFASPIYFSYVVPLILLAMIPVIRSIPGRTQPVLTAMMGFYLVFGALDLQPMRLPGLGGPLEEEQLARLDLPRGGLRIGAVQAGWYREAVELLRANATSGVIYAGPDAPEIYFLAELRNPTPAIFDFLVPDTLFHAHLVEELDRNRISAVALKYDFIHSPPLEPDIVKAFESRFPASRQIGTNFFTIRWTPPR
jgi:hypothetical protein